MAEVKSWHRGPDSAAQTIAVVGRFLPVIPLPAEQPGPKVYRGTEITEVEELPQHCAEISSLSVTVPECIGPGSTVVVTVTVGTGINHLVGEYDCVELFIYRSPDDCERYPGYFMKNVPTWLRSMNYNSNSTFQRAFYFDMGLTRGETFHVNGNMEYASGPSGLTTGYIVAVYHPGQSLIAHENLPAQAFSPNNAEQRFESCFFAKESRNLNSEFRTRDCYQSVKGELPTFGKPRTPTSCLVDPLEDPQSLPN